MKRIVIIASSFLVLFSCAAAAKTWTVGFLMGAEIGVQSGFILMASQGLYKARQEHGFTVITETPEDVSQQAMSVAFQKLISRKPDLIMTTGYQMAEHAKTFAPQHPEILFLVNDVGIENMPNVMSTAFAADEGSFLAGALAGWMTKGTVGVIAGVNIPTVASFLTGYKNGVRYANPNVLMKEIYLSEPPDFSGFKVPEKGAKLAEDWYGQGVDIIFAAAGLTGNGIIYQARKSRKYVIGVDIDQDSMAKGYVLTSMVKRMDVAVYLAVSQIVQGNFQPGIRRYGLKEKGVGLTEMKYTRHLIPDEILKKLKDAEEKIISGQIQVTAGLSEK